MALPAPSFTVELPTGFQGGPAPGDATMARAVAARATVDLRSNAERKVEYSITPAAQGGRVDLTLLWPDGRPTDEVRVHGTVTLTWPPGVIECPAVPPSGEKARPPAKQLPPHFVEHLGERLSAELKASAKATGGTGLPTPPGEPESTEQAVDCRSSAALCDDVKVEACAICDARWASLPPWTCPAGEVCDYLDTGPTRFEALRPGEDPKAMCDRIAKISPSLSKEFPKLEWKCPANGP
jgi:hypothetical protein